MPSDFWNLFWLNRHLFNKIPPLAANIIKNLSAKQGFLPGIYLAIHTFGRDLKNNVHIHLSTTIGGLDIKSQSTWIKSAYFHLKNLKAKWKYQIINLFRSEFKNGNLILTPELRHLKNLTMFNKFLDIHYQKQWVVQLNKKSDNIKHNVEYLGK